LPQYIDGAAKQFAQKLRDELYATLIIPIVVTGSFDVKLKMYISPLYFWFGRSEDEYETTCRRDEGALLIK
jgi:hypothetical protein